MRRTWDLNSDTSLDLSHRQAEHRPSGSASSYLIPILALRNEGEKLASWCEKQMLG